MNRKKIIILALALITILSATIYVGFYPIEGTKDINTLGTVTVYKQTGYGVTFVEIGAGNTYDVSIPLVPLVYVKFVGQFASDNVKARLIDSSGNAAMSVLRSDDLTVSDGKMEWLFEGVRTLSPDEYHVSFAGFYSETQSLSGVTYDFFILGGTGTARPSVISSPTDIVTVVNDAVTVSWTYTQVLASTWEVTRDGVSVLTGIGNVGSSTPQSVTYTFTPTTAKDYTVKLTVTAGGNIATDDVVVSSVGTPTSSTTTTTTPTSTTTTTPTGSTTTTTIPTTSGGTTITTTTEEEPTGGFEIGYFLIAGVAAIVVIVLLKRKRLGL